MVYCRVPKDLILTLLIILIDERITCHYMNLMCEVKMIYHLSIS